MDQQMFTVEEFTNVIRFIWNRPDFEFVKMYNSIGFPGKSYIMEKYELARKDFGSWWSNLDPFTQAKVILYVNDFYKK